jgi:hypothetical protein
MEKWESAASTFKSGVSKASDFKDVAFAKGKEGLHQLPKAGLIGAGLSIGLDYWTYKDSMSKGEALGRGLVNYAAWSTAPWLMGIATAGSIAGAAVPAVMARYDKQSAKFNSYYRPNVGGTFTDTMQASTMRQAAQAAIQNNKLNARVALGNEASLMHRY